MTSFFCRFSITDLVQIISAVGTVVAAIFSWKAVQQAGEIAFKPILELQLVIYHDFNKTLSLNIHNLSKEGDRWVKKVLISIKDLDLFKKQDKYIEPGKTSTVYIQNVDKDLLTGKDIRIEYYSLNNKVYIQKYRIKHVKEIQAPLFKIQTYIVGIERV